MAKVVVNVSQELVDALRRPELDRVLEVPFHAHGLTARLEGRTIVIEGAAGWALTSAEKEIRDIDELAKKGEFARERETDGGV